MNNFILVNGLLLYVFKFKEIKLLFFFYNLPVSASILSTNIINDVLSFWTVLALWDERCKNVHYPWRYVLFLQKS